MKKGIKPFYLMLFTVLGLVATSCSEDDDTPVGPVDPIEELDPDDLQGEISENVTLDASETYHLTGELSVLSGAKLTIPAGTEIIADTDVNDNNPATGVYIVVQQGGMIDIQGTATNPVVMSSSSGEAGSWGGLLIAGKAETTAGVNVTAEVADLVYGGSNPTDNSGSINYLVLADAGAQIDAESQYNGISLYAVGSGTSISNVAILNGADDGIEFFGGSVSASNLYLENNEDDAVDWTEGWDGSVDNVYVNHTIDNFSTAIEADGQNGNPTITNFTAVSTTGGTALQFKKLSGATITGLSLSGYDTNIDITEAGRTDLSDIEIDGEDAAIDAAYDADATVDVNTFNWMN